MSMTWKSLKEKKMYLKKCCLTALSYWVYSVLVETAGGGDGGVVVHPLGAVHSPVVVAVVVHAALAVKHQAILTNLLSQGPCNMTG